tara:strand:+ start:31 stop:489 length:459 start_codon:yes stop_codon:yes gene_type:complete
MKKLILVFIFLFLSINLISQVSSRFEVEKELKALEEIDQLKIIQKFNGVTIKTTNNIGELNKSMISMNLYPMEMTTYYFEENNEGVEILEKVETIYASSDKNLISEFAPPSLPKRELSSYRYSQICTVVRGEITYNNEYKMYLVPEFRINLE